MSIMGDSKIALRVKVDRFGKEESHDSDSVSSLFFFIAGLENTFLLLYSSVPKSHDIVTVCQNEQ